MMMMRRRRRHTHSWLFLTHIYQWVEIILNLCASNYRCNLLLYVYFWWQESHYGKILFSLHKIQVLVKSSLGEKGLTHAIKAFRCSKLNINNNHIFCRLLVWHNFATRFAQCVTISLLSYLTLNTINRTDGWTDIIIAPSTRSRRGSSCELLELDWSNPSSCWSTIMRAFWLFVCAPLSLLYGGRQNVDSRGCQFLATLTAHSPPSFNCCCSLTHILGN